MRLLRAVATAAAVLCGAATLLARSYSRAAWPIDLIATFALHWAYLFVGLAVICLLIRLRIAACVLLAAAGAHLVWSAANGPPRAADGARGTRA